MIWTDKIPINTNIIKKILVIQFQTYSDVFLASATFETLKKSFPEAELHFLLKEPFQEIVNDHPYLDNIISFPIEKNFKYFTSRLKLFHRINKMKFDIVIDLQNNVGSSQVCLFSGAKYRIGFNDGRLSFVYNYKVLRDSEKYLASQKFDLLKPLGIIEEDWRFHFQIKKQSHAFIDKWLNEIGLKHKEFMILSPGSSLPSKKWRTSFYASLGDLIVENLGLSVVLIGTKSEQSDCHYTLEHMRNKPFIAPEMSLNQVAALLQRARLLVCNDGALNQFSCATETQTIAIFGNTFPMQKSPASIASHHHHLFKEDYPSKTDDSFGISPQDVMNKIKEIL